MNIIESLNRLPHAVSFRECCRALLHALRTASHALRHAYLRTAFYRKKPGTLTRAGGFHVRIADGHSFYTQYKDIFLHNIYHFKTFSKNPLIIDGGCSVGVSVLYFKHLYPDARILGFEPDPGICRMLEDTVRLNNLDSVKIITAALGSTDGSMPFTADSSDGGCIDPGKGTSMVTVARLSPYITEPVDLLKLNIEGQELQVLLELEEACVLNLVRKLIIEYHGWAHAEQKLGSILTLLERNGYRYLVHDFDAETCPNSKPPFRFDQRNDWYCLIAACKMQQ